MNVHRLDRLKHSIKAPSIGTCTKPNTSNTRFKSNLGIGRVPFLAFQGACKGT